MWTKNGETDVCEGEIHFTLERATSITKNASEPTFKNFDIVSRSGALF
jgi:hypothetical protein